MVFVKRKLDEEPKSLSEKLRALRRNQAVTLDLIEKRTHIQRNYLEALEEGRFEDLPEPLYSRNFIRSYARALGADEKYFLELYDEECGLCDLIEPMCSPRQRVKSKRFYIWSRFVRYGLIASLLLCVLSYIGYQVVSIIAPPEVVLLSPADDILTHEAMITVQGFVEGEASVYINGEPIVVYDDFTFEAIIDLEQGLNDIVVEAERRYSRRAVIERSVVFDPQSWISQVGYFAQ